MYVTLYDGAELIHEEKSCDLTSNSRLESFIEGMGKEGAKPVQLVFKEFGFSLVFKKHKKTLIYPQVIKLNAQTTINTKLFDYLLTISEKYGLEKKY